MKRASIALVILALASTASAEDTQPYIVQPDDSCLGIAVRVLGSRDAVRDIHRLNPQLGALPHHLVPGSVLVLPASPPAGPDARVTSTHGDVKVRPPSTTTWNAAARGMDLFRAYRVGASTAASAELTFGDDAMLAMRERTTVVIYGPEKRLAKILTATAELERGTLESRLGELDGKPVVVRTPAAEADLRAGDVVVTAGAAGPSLVSNHRGGAIQVRGRTKARESVRVAAGMGTRVVPGKPPEPPRPLPPAPAWTTTSGPRIAGATNTVTLAWTPVERAATYRIAVREPTGGSDLAAFVVSGSAATAELPLAPGAYRVTVAALDVDELESVPSPALDIEVVAPQFIAPGARLPDAGAGTPMRIAAGTAIIAPEGFACVRAGGGEPVHRLVLEQPGHAAVRCESARGATNTLELDVVALARAPLVAAQGSTPPRADVTASIQPGPAHPARNTPWRRTLGVFGGLHAVGLRKPSSLTAPDDYMHAIDDGPTTGLRADIVHGAFGFSPELAVSWLDRRGAPGHIRVTSVRAHGLLVDETTWATLQLVAGVGLDLADDTTSAMFSWGGSVAIPVASSLSLRADLRHLLSRGLGGGVAQGMLATLGLSIDVP